MPFESLCTPAVSGSRQGIRAASHAFLQVPAGAAVILHWAGGASLAVALLPVYQDSCFRGTMPGLPGLLRTGHLAGAPPHAGVPRELS